MKAGGTSCAYVLSGRSSSIGVGETFPWRVPWNLCQVAKKLRQLTIESRAGHTNLGDEKANAVEILINLFFLSEVPSAPC